MTSQTITAAASGTWKLGDQTVHRVGFGTMRLPQHGEAFAPAVVPRDRDQAINVLRRAVELGVNHIDTTAFYFSPLRSANELINRALAPYPDDLAGLRLRRMRRATVSDPVASEAADLIGRDFTAAVVNTKHVGDITHLPLTGGKFLYLATVIDLASRRLAELGDRRSHACRTGVTEALAAAERRRASLAGAVVHTDHGAQYTSRAFTDACPRAGVIRSMSAVGSSVDNTPAEPFNATCEREIPRSAVPGPTSVKSASTYSGGCTATTPDAVTPASENAVASPTRQHSAQHQLPWPRPHSPCSRSRVKPHLQPAAKTRTSCLSRAAELRETIIPAHWPGHGAAEVRQECDGFAITKRAACPCG
ncbi:aldo/keto reductase [Streptomyces lasalocidi]